MKKVISLLVALAAACSVSVAAFAADDDPGVVRPGTRINIVEGVNPDTNLGWSGVQVGAHELFLVDASRKVVGGIYNRLDPDTEYTFRIYYNPGDTVTETNANGIANLGQELTGATLSNGTVQLRTVKGSSNIQSARIKTIGRGAAAKYDLVLTTRAYFGTKINDVEYSLDVTGSTQPAGTFAKSNHMFEVGYEPIEDSMLDVGEDGIITISNDAPVITKDQFVTIAKSANYKTVTFEAEDANWMFTGRVSGMGDSNFTYTYDVVPEIINKFPDQEYKFLNFRSGVTFPTNGEMRIDVSEINDEFRNMHTYLYRNGRLTLIDTTYDSGANEVVFRTNYLGAFVITDTLITDTSILGEEEETREEEEEGVNNEQGPAGTGNPNTGADSAMNIAVTLGLVSLVAASAISRKKK